MEIKESFAHISI